MTHDELIKKRQKEHEERKRNRIDALHATNNENA